MVPGSIFSANSAGVHQFLKLGATPVTCAADILEALNIPHDSDTPTQNTLDLSPAEARILDLLQEPVHRDELIRKLAIPTAEASQTLMLLELQGCIVSEQNIYRRTR